MAFKLITGRTHLNPFTLFLPSLRSTQSRKHQYQIRAKAKNSKTEKSFANRIISDWNELDSDIVSSKTPQIFKRKLIDKIGTYFINGL